MKEKLLKIALLWCLVVAFAACTSDENDNPQYSELRNALQATGMFYNISADPDTTVIRERNEGKLNYKEQYSMFFKQPVNHDEEGGEEFMQKVCILFRGFDRPTVFVTNGYNWPDFRDSKDLAANLDANMIHVEHRNYGESYNQDQGTWKYQTVAQASADLHAVRQALKPLFPGKWMSSGTSKNGETSICYAYHYPQDVDLAMSFCSPFVLGLDDVRFGPYLMEEVGTEESRNMMKQLIRKGLENGENGLYKDVRTQVEAGGKKELVFDEYVFNLFDAFFQIFLYTPTTAERNEMMAGMMQDYDALKEYVVSIIEGNRSATIYSYWIEAAKEIGWQNDGYSYFSDLLGNTSFDENNVLPSMMNNAEDRWLVNTYDGGVYDDIVNNFFMTTTCPLLLYYVHDDPWTAGMPKKVGPNVKKIINPIGKHHSALNDPSLCPPAIKHEVMEYVQKYIY